MYVGKGEARKLNPRLQILEDNGVDWRNKYEVTTWDALKKESADRSAASRAAKKQAGKYANVTKDDIDRMAAEARAAPRRAGLTQAGRDEQVRNILNRKTTKGEPTSLATKAANLALVIGLERPDRGGGGVCLKVSELDANGRPMKNKTVGQPTTVYTGGEWVGKPAKPGTKSSGAYSMIDKYHGLIGGKKIKGELSQDQIKTILQKAVREGWLQQYYAAEDGMPCAYLNDPDRPKILDL